MCQVVTSPEHTSAVVRVDGGSSGNTLLIEHDEAVEEVVGLQVEDSTM